MAKKATVSIKLDLTESQALALAQFTKRVCWSELRGCAVSDDEAYKIREGIELMQDELANNGFSPR